MNHEFAQIIGGSRWLMEPKAFRAMVQRAGTATAEAIHAAVHAYGERQPSLNMMGDVAVIPMCGPITYRRSLFSMFFGGATIEDMQMQFRMALRDETVKTIAFRCDCVGGAVDMVPEFADEVFAARGQKLIVAIADTMIASAALWIAAQADTIYTSASGQIGSVGVWTAHEEVSQMLEQLGVKVTLIAYGSKKLEGNPYEPLTDEARATIQAQVDAVGKEFDAALARGRGVSTADVRASFGQGQIFRGRQAIAVGLADKMGTIGQVVAKAGRGRMSAAAFMAMTAHVVEADEPVRVAKTVPDQVEMVEPKDDECPEGYEMGEDGMCHLMDEDAKAKSADVKALLEATPTPQWDRDLESRESYMLRVEAYMKHQEDICHANGIETKDEQIAREQAAADDDALAVALALSE